MYLLWLYVRPTHTHTHRHTLTPTQTQAQTHTYTYIYIHKHTHTHTHTHYLTQIQTYIPSVPRLNFGAAQRDKKSLDHMYSCEPHVYSCEPPFLSISRFRPSYIVKVAILMNITETEPVPFLHR